jgi:precorrin-6B methylase 2
MAMTKPDLDRALELYDREAPRYDRATQLLDPVRRHAIKRLAIESGDVVVEPGCGTGLNLTDLAVAVGPDGLVIGIEPSAAMLAQADERVSARSLENVQLVNADAATARLSETGDKLLFSYTHDLMRSPVAIDNLVGQMRDGGLVVAAGAMLAPLWAIPVNAVLWSRIRRYVTTTEGLRQPWSPHLERHLHAIAVERMLYGTAYVVSGRLRDG